MKKEWNVETSIRSISLYYHRTVALEILEQRDKTAGVTAEINKQIGKAPADYAKAILDTLGRKSVEQTNDPAAHPKVIDIWVSMFAKIQEQEIRKRALKIKERRIRMLERRDAEARETMQNSKLTDAEKAAGIYRIFYPSSHATDEAPTEKNGTNGFAD